MNILYVSESTGNTAAINTIKYISLRKTTAILQALCCQLIDQKAEVISPTINDEFVIISRGGAITTSSGSTNENIVDIEQYFLDIGDHVDGTARTQRCLHYQ